MKDLISVNRICELAGVSPVTVYAEARAIGLSPYGKSETGRLVWTFDKSEAGKVVASLKSRGFSPSTKSRGRRRQ